MGRFHGLGLYLHVLHDRVAAATWFCRKGCGFDLFFIEQWHCYTYIYIYRYGTDMIWYDMIWYAFLFSDLFHAHLGFEKHKRDILRQFIGIMGFISFPSFFIKMSGVVPQYQFTQDQYSPSLPRMQVDLGASQDLMSATIQMNFVVKAAGEFSEFFWILFPTGPGCFPSEGCFPSDFFVWIVLWINPWPSGICFGDIFDLLSKSKFVWLDLCPTNLYKFRIYETFWSFDLIGIISYNIFDYYWEFFAVSILSCQSASNCCDLSGMLRVFTWYITIFYNRKASINTVWLVLWHFLQQNWLESGSPLKKCACRSGCCNCKEIRAVFSAMRSQPARHLLEYSQPLYPILGDGAQGSVCVILCQQFHDVILADAFSIICFTWRQTCS